MPALLRSSVGSLLKKIGIEIRAHRYDMDSWFVSRRYEDLLVKKTANKLDDFLSEQDVIHLDKGLKTAELTREFYDYFKNRPKKGQRGGLTFNGALCLYAYIRHLKPGLIIESGTYVGQSTWTLRLAAPNAQIHSFDIDLSNLEYNDDSIHYHQQDWSTFNFADIDPQNTVCFFDDHVDQVKRLVQCEERGLRNLIFDDNTPLEWLHLATRGAPMLDFLFCDALIDGENITWIMRGKEYSYRVDASHLSIARSYIQKYAKFPVPELCSINGYSYGNPLTIILLK